MDKLERGGGLIYGFSEGGECRGGVAEAVWFCLLV